MAEQESPEKSIFLTAIEIESSVERAAYLTEACAGNAELRGEIEALILAHHSPLDLLGSRAGVSQSIDAPEATERLCGVIGPFRLLDQIGEGGMGTVFLAEQTEPIQRKVALKIIKRGMDSAQVLARFEAERQALAMMDHVNIARVLDAGTTESGRPYFVMELVDGVPITTFCDDNRLTPRERLELFVPVCQAIQHAHQKGIIHRDVKPSNVMITMYDGKPTPKVIDFGVAKATEQNRIPGTNVTQFGTLVGTPEYMSPEQAEMTASGVDTRSDIFSLGVLLYELLTGSTPLTHRRLKEAAYGEILRMVKEEEPPKPSTRLSDSGDALASISAQRSIEPAKLTKLVRGDLDWIVMKCLEKDRNRRYATANEFATDLQHYLADEPVQACPPSAGYRMRKFVRRHRGPVLAASAFAVLLLAGIITTSWQAWRATRAERQALALKNQAEANFQLAKEAVDNFLNAVTEHPKLNEQDFYQLRKELLETAVPFYRKFAEERRDDPESEAARGRAFHRLALVRDVMGEKEAALADYESMRTIFAKLAADFPNVPSYRFDRAQSENNIGNLLFALGRVVEAVSAYRDALRTKQQLADEFPGEPRYRWEFAKTHNGLGLLLKDLGRIDEAEAAFRTALTIQRQLSPQFLSEPVRRCQLANSQNSLAILLKTRERYEEAETLHRDALRIFGQLAHEFPKSALYRHNLAVSHNNFANLMKSQRKHADAETAHRVAQSLFQQLADDFPSVPEYREDLGMSHHNLASFFNAQGQCDDALSSYAKAIAIRERLLADFPSVAKYAVSLGASYKNLGIVSKKKDDPEAVMAWLAKAISTLESAFAKEPQLITAREELAQAYATRARLMGELERHGDAVKDWERAIKFAVGTRKEHYEQHRILSLQRSGR